MSTQRDIFERWAKSYFKLNVSKYWVSEVEEYRLDNIDAAYRGFMSTQPSIDIDVPHYKAEIAKLRAQVAEQQWISVDDREPDLNQQVIVYLSPREAHSAIKTVTTTFTKYGYERACVTHWMPLPSPPAKEGES